MWKLRNRSHLRTYSAHVVGVQSGLLKRPHLISVSVFVQNRIADRLRHVQQWIFRIHAKIQRSQVLVYALARCFDDRFFQALQGKIKMSSERA